MADQRSAIKEPLQSGATFHLFDAKCNILGNLMPVLMVQTILLGRVDAVARIKRVY